MRGFGDRLKRRAKELGLSGAEVARRANIGESRYSNYANDINEPDLEAVVRLAYVLEATPGQLLGAEDMPPLPGQAAPRQAWIDTLLGYLPMLSEDELRILVRWVKVAHRVRRGLE